MGINLHDTDESCDHHRCIPILHNFIKKYRVYDKNNKHTNNEETYNYTLLGEPWGKYLIPDDKLNEFFEHVGHCAAHKQIMFFTEKHKPFSPIVVDLDFETKESKRQYTLDIIKTISEIYVKLIKQYTKVPSKKINIYILEKEKPSEKKQGDETIYKDGFHIIFPEFPLPTNLQYLLRIKVMEKVKELDLFKNIHFLKSLEEVFDESVIYRNGWQLYGSSKPGHQVYQLTHILDHQLIDLELKLTKKEIKELPKKLSIRKFEEEDWVGYKNDYNDENIDLELKVNAESKKKKQRELKKNNSIKSEKSPKSEKSKKSDQSTVFKDLNGKKGDQFDIDIAKKLLNILNPSRADDYHEWIQLGWCLHNIDDCLLADWIKFSQQSKKFKEGECEKLWSNFRNEGYTIASLYKWARDDDEVAFIVFRSTQIFDSMESALSGTHAAIARVIHKMYRYSYRCVPKTGSQQIWFEYKKHRWHKVEGAFTLSNKISQDLRNEFFKLQSHFLQKQTEENNKGDNRDKEAYDRYENKKKMIDKITHDLEMGPFKRNVLSECTNLFLEDSEGFMEKLDENKNLLGFDNGVYDFKNNFFRDGSPDDCITLSTKTTYIPYDKNHAYIKEIKKYFREVYPVKAVRRYVLDILALSLCGEKCGINKNKFYIWIGGGANGKSTTIKLMQFILGEYFCTSNVQALTSARGSAESASPGKAKLKGKRFTVLQEPDNSAHLNTGIMKELTGDDVIEARKLYSEPIEFIPQCSYVMITNKLPYIDVAPTDGGTWRRIRVVPHISKFVKDDEVNIDKNCYPIDPEMNAKLNEWKSVFASFLIHRYQRKNGFKKPIKEPKEVKVSTDNYKAKNNIFESFKSDILAQTKDGKQSIDMKTIYSAFRNWAKGNAPDSGKGIQRQDLKDYFENMDYKIVKDRVFGIILQTENEDPEYEENPEINEKGEKQNKIIRKKSEEELDENSEEFQEKQKKFKKKKSKFIIETEDDLDA